MRTVPELVFLNCCHLAGRDVKDFGRPDCHTSPPTWRRS